MGIADFPTVLGTLPFTAVGFFAGADFSVLEPLALPAAALPPADVLADDIFFTTFLATFLATFLIAFFAPLGADLAIFLAGFFAAAIGHPLLKSLFRRYALALAITAQGTLRDL